MSTIEERVKKIVIEQLGVKEEDVTTSASFVDDLGGLADNGAGDGAGRRVRGIPTKMPRRSAPLRSTTSRPTSRRESCPRKGYLRNHPRLECIAARAASRFCVLCRIEMSNVLHDGSRSHYVEAPRRRHRDGHHSPLGLDSGQQLGWHLQRLFRHQHGRRLDVTYPTRIVGEIAASTSPNGNPESYKWITSCTTAWRPR